MRINRKGMVLGVATLGVVGTLAGGVGVAQATSDTPTPSATASAPPYGHGFGLRGHGVGNSPINAAADYLGLSLTDLQTRLRSDETLAQVAEAQDKSVSGVKDAMIAAVKTRIEANTRLTAEQKTDLLAQATTRVDTMINEGCPAGTGPGNGHRGGGMGHRMGGIGR